MYKNSKEPNYQEFLSKTIEIQKISKISKLFAIIAVGSVIGTISIGVLAPDILDKIGIVVIFFMLLSIYTACVIYNILSNKRHAISENKGIVISAALNSLGVNLSSAGKCVQAIDLLSSGDLAKIYRGNRYITEDALVGEWNGSQFRFLECSIVKESGSRKDKSSTRVFKGQIYSIQKNLEVHSSIYVVLKKGAPLIFSHRLIELEDVEFNKMFYVICQEEVVVRKILTPRYMEYIKQLGSSLKGKVLTISFTHYGITVMTDIKRDMFEVEVNQNTQMHDISNQIKEDLDIMINVCKTITSF